MPDAKHEALRGLVRARSAAKQDESRAKHRLTKYLLRYGLRHPKDSRTWTRPCWCWVQNLEFEHEEQRVTLGDCIADVLDIKERIDRLDLEALQALRG